MSLSPNQGFPLIFPFRRRSRTEPSGINCPIFLAGHGQGARSGTEGFRKNTVPYSSSLATRTIGVTEFGHSDFLLPFVNFLMLMHRNVQLLLFGNLYAERLVPYYIQEGYL